MLSLSHKNFLLSLCSLLVCVCMTTGCSTLSPMGNKKVPVSQEASQGQYRVEMQSTFGKAQPYVGTINGNMTVQDVLEQSGATKKYRAMNVEVLRVVNTPETGNRGLRMKVNYKTSTKSVMPEQNYAVLDGDRIIVEPLANGPISKVIGMMDQSN